VHAPPRRTDAPASSAPPRGTHGGRGRRPLAALAAAVLAAPLLLAASAAPATATASGTAGSAADAARTASPQRAGHGGDPAKEGDRLARELVRRTGAKGAMRHLKVLQAIARAGHGTRAAGSRGHELSAKYAGTVLKAAGYEVTYQDFDFTYRETLAEKLSVRTPDPRDVPVKLMTYTKSTPEGGTEAALAPVPVDADGSSGCTADDYASGDFKGRIALIQRGSCSFAEKQAAAADAGAVAAVIYNNTDGELDGTIGEPADGRIPTGGVSMADGEALADAAAKGEVKVNVELRELQEQRSTPNVIAETPGGDPGHVVMLGAHLDSVTDGPGINDNASGSAGILETALQFAAAGGTGHGHGHGRPGRTGNKVRFALWTAEEVGLLGADHYVAGLSAAQRDKIALYLNFDMIASPNYGLFVYDGDDSDGTGAGPGPEGSARLEKDIADFVATRGEETRGADFTGRSDYGPFIEAGIPSGGSETGAEGIKTAAEQKLWGGTADEAYDSCYHKACDDLGNIDKKAFDINVKVMANAVGHYARDVSALP